jgi:hypothetical protein
MSKFLLNLLLQISKAFLYSNIQFLFRKEFFLPFWPNRPSGQQAHPDFWPTQPTQPFFLLPHRSKVPPPSPAARRRPTPPRLHPAMGALPRAPHRIPRPLPLLPSSFCRVKHRLKSEPFHPINTGNSSALTTPPLLGHYKRGSTPPSSTTPPPTQLLHCRRPITTPLLRLGWGPKPNPGELFVLLV